MRPHAARGRRARLRRTRSRWPSAERRARLRARWRRPASSPRRRRADGRRTQPPALPPRRRRRRVPWRRLRALLPETRRRRPSGASRPPRSRPPGCWCRRCPASAVPPTARRHARRRRASSPGARPSDAGSAPRHPTRRRGISFRAATPRAPRPTRTRARRGTRAPARHPRALWRGAGRSRRRRRSHPAGRPARGGRACVWSAWPVRQQRPARQKPRAQGCGARPLRANQEVTGEQVNGVSACVGPPARHRTRTRARLATSALTLDLTEAGSACENLAVRIGAVRPLAGILV